MRIKALSAHAVEDAMDFSQSLARRRHLVSDAIKIRTKAAGRGSLTAFYLTNGEAFRMRIKTDPSDRATITLAAIRNCSAVNNNRP
jgi:hypothetical protein